MYDLEAIRSHISLVALAEEAGAVFDNRLSSHCPLPRHAGDRSSLAFTIYDNGRRWKGHSACPADANGGDVIQSYMLWKDVDFKTACAELSARIGASPVQPTHPEPAPASSRLSPSPPAEKWRCHAEQFITWQRPTFQAKPGQGLDNIWKRSVDCPPKPSARFSWATTRPTSMMPLLAGGWMAARSSCRAGSSFPVLHSSNPGT